jgi:septal ring factor EnvC (AmiA/AmiB activator)
MEPAGAEVGSAERSRRRGRARPTRRRRAVIVVAATLAGVAVIVVAGLSFVHGSRWKERADERGARITDLEDELEATEAELQALEDRVGALTEEVSAAQDQLFIAELDVDQARELAALAGAVARDLASCVDGTSELVRIVRDLEAYDPAAATAYAEQVDQVCGRALAGNDLLQESLG